MLFRLCEIEVHCLAVPCTSSVQHELASHSAPFLIIFLCVCVCGVSQQLEWDRGSQRHVSGCQQCQRGEWVPVSVCTRQTGRPATQGHDWVHHPPSDLSYGGNHNACVCWCVCTGVYNGDPRTGASS